MVRVLYDYSLFLPVESKNCANNAIGPGQSELIPKLSQFNKRTNQSQKTDIHSSSNIMPRKAIT